MAGRLAFHFTPGDSGLHRWDARCKLPALLILSVGFLRMNIYGLLIFSLLLIPAVALARLPWRAVSSELRIWWLLLMVLFILHAVSIDNPGYHPSTWLTVTEQSTALAALACWRLTLILCYSLLFMLTTKSSDVRNTLLWFLRPIPYLPARRIATMMALTIRFIPIIMDQAEEVQVAVRCRGGHLRKSPVFRMKSTALPVLRRTLLKADELALALGARGYREDLPVRIPSFPIAHLFPLIALATVVGIAVRPL